MNSQNFKNTEKSFPVSTDTLEFIQNQIALAYGMTSMAGKNFVVKSPVSDTEPGLIVLNGELMPLMHSVAVLGFIEIVEDKQEVVAQNVYYLDSRIVRYARYRADKVGSYIETAKLEPFMPLNEITRILTEEIKVGLDDARARIASEEVQTHQNILPRLHTVEATANNANGLTLPVGSIIMWNNYRTIPENFAICDGENGTPDLINRFPRGTNDSTQIDEKGGADSVFLDKDHLPKHTHKLFLHNTGKRFTGGGGANELDSGSGHTSENDTEHLPLSILPSYTTVFFIMKLY